MRTLHLDAFSGIAGNMFLAALLDLGLSRAQLARDLRGLGVPHTLRVRRVSRGPLAARYVEVGPPRAPGRKRGARRAHGRSYAEIRRLLRAARLDAGVRARALAIFEALGRAEAAVHGTPLERVHFHEVGAIDAIVDVTGAAIGLARLGIERVTASPVALGGGTVETEHGLLPLPAPATLELLRGIPTVPAHVAFETVTPTGAAILRTVVDEFGSLPAMTIEAIGHGAGDDRRGGLPNVLRAVLGSSRAVRSDRIVCLETNLDDLVPEHFDYLMERLFEDGALDVSIQHIQMKKNRPGFLVRVLARPSERIALSRVLFAESTAIGVRATESDRLVLEREERRVSTPFGRLGVKLVWDGDGRALVSAEYDDCKRAARKAGVPLRDVVRAAEEAGRALL
ncbi:MAG: nickel pincer cofactor biosynthesis protein LarC [Myxococcota bacterium]